MNFKKLIFIGFFTFIIAQHNHGDHGYRPPKIASIKGSVYDSNTEAPISYASISLFSLEDGDLVSGGITDDNGMFYIDKLFPGSYKIIIEFIGFENHVIPEISLNRENGINQDIGKVILIQKSLELEEIKIIDDRPLYEFETDKIVYNASDDIITGSGTAEDVLKKVPMVTVNNDGEVLLRGNGNVKILVNGRPNRSGGDVDNISASIIEKVEVVTSPSAKYDPEGMAGIINIVLKKGNYDGFNGSLRLNGRANNDFTPEDANGITLYGNYRKDKWNFYSSFSNNNRVRNSSGYRKVTTNYYDLDNLPTDPEIVDFTYIDSTDRFSQKLNIGADYYLSDEIILNAEATYSNHYKKNGSGSIFSDGTIINTLEKDDKDNYDLDGFFQVIKSYHDNPDKEWNISLTSDHGNDFEFEQLVEDASDDITYLDNSFNNSEIDFHYKSSLSSDSKFEIGYDGRFVNYFEYLDFNVDVLEGIYDFNYERDIHGVYFEYEKKINEKFSVKPSIRYEYVSSNIFTELRNTNLGDFVYDDEYDYKTFVDWIIDKYANSELYESYNNNYATTYPDLHFTYNINEDKSIQFGLSKRVERPGSGRHGGGGMQIKPFPRDIYSKDFLFIGNPFLKPEYSTQYDISYKAPAPMGFFYTNFYYHELENVISWYDDDTVENQDVLTFRNSDRGYNYGVELFMMIAGQTLGGSYRKTDLSDDSNDYQLNEGNYFTNMYCRITLPEKYIKWFDFEYGFYWMKIKTPSGTLFGEDGTIWANLSFSKTFLDRRLRVSLSIDNLFDNGGFEMLESRDLSEDEYDSSLYSSATEITDVDNDRNGRTVSLSFKYNFGKLEEDKNKHRRKSHDHDGGDMDMGY